MKKFREYGFESFFCQPGLKGAHEKGGVEGEIGRFRRWHLVPVPKSATLAEVNEDIGAGDLLDDSRVITGRPITVGAAFAAERTTLMPLPAEAFDPALMFQASVDKRARICVRQCYYSVPARYVARRLSVRLSARTVKVFDGPKCVAVHERAFGRYVEVLLLDHYLEVLKTKPGGLPGATALVQAKACGTFTHTTNAIGMPCVVPAVTGPGPAPWSRCSWRTGPCPRRCWSPRWTAPSAQVTWTSRSC